LYQTIQPQEERLLDLVLAVIHHLLIFSLFGVLMAEFVVVRPGMTNVMVERIAAIDLWYGALAALILAIGFGRVIFASKGWLYYSHNAFFWAKIGVFVIIGLLSVPPTLAFIRWRKAADAPEDPQISRIRGLLWAEVGLFLLLPVFAAAMARGYGEFG
jgi:putative membrane protein